MVCHSYPKTPPRCQAERPSGRLCARILTRFWFFFSTFFSSPLPRAFCFSSSQRQHTPSCSHLNMSSRSHRRMWGLRLFSWVWFYQSGSAISSSGVCDTRVLQRLFHTDGDTDYHAAKAEYQRTAKVPRGWKREDLDRGFNTTGLWAYCRHPNFTAEQTIWFILYQWSCYATKVLYTWTGVGSLCLMLLFQGSTRLTEKITAGKYLEYKYYQEQVGMQIPSLKPYSAPQAKRTRQKKET
jgi:hypothetical protein